MSVTHEIRRTLSDPKPLYALAGAGDLAAAKLREAPTLLTEAAATVSTLANRIAAEAPEQIAKVQARLAEVPGALDPRAVAANLDPRGARESIRGVVGNVDTQALRDKAQTLALIQVGRVLEAAGKAVETYDGLAVRGKTVVERYRGTVEGSVEDVTVVVEQVVVDEPEQVESEPKAATATNGKSAPSTSGSGSRASAKPKVEDAEVAGAASASSAKPQASQAKKTASAPRKRASSSSAPKSAKA
jgi:hypothetical protein